MCVPQLHWYLSTVDRNTYCYMLFLLSIWSRYLAAEMSIESRNPDEILFLTKLFWVQKYITSLIFLKAYTIMADSSGRAVLGAGMQPLACWDCGFEFHQGHQVCLWLSVVCCQVVISATGRSLVQRNPTECYRKISTMRKSWPTRGCRAITYTVQWHKFQNSEIDFTATFCTLSTALL
jgi:predicted Zn-ribbon and HTH transcriptional regulator